MQQVDLVVQGHAMTDLGPLEISLRLDAAVRRTGRGPLELHVVASDWTLTGVELLWVVTTNKGWTHLRGTARLAEGAADQPIRMDIYGGGLGGPPNPERIALRLYPPGSDPNLAGPIVKLMGTFEEPAVGGTEGLLPSPAVP
jgi:hypothetical protein